MNVVPHLFWITSRAAGATALFACSAGVGVGLLVGARAQVPGRRDLRPLHEVLSLATLAFVAVHALALLGDGWLGFGPADLAGSLPRLLPAAVDRPRHRRELRPRPARHLLLLPRPGRQVRWRRLHRFTAAFWISPPSTHWAPAATRPRSGSSSSAASSSSRPPPSWSSAGCRCRGSERPRPTSL